MKHLAIICTALVLAFSLASCDTTTAPVTPRLKDTTYVASSDHVAFILNEGNFKKNSSLDAIVYRTMLHIHDTLNKSDTTLSYDTLEHRDVLSGLGEGNDILVWGNDVVVLDNAGALYLVQIDSLKLVGKIDLGLTQPNKMAFISPDQILVTRRSATSAAIVDLALQQIIDTIGFGEPTISVAVVNGKAFVTSGGYTPPSHVNVIDLAAHSVTPHAWPITSSLAISNAGEQCVPDSAHNRALVMAIGDFNSLASRLYAVDAASGKFTDSVTVGTPKDDVELTTGTVPFLNFKKSILEITTPFTTTMPARVTSQKALYKGGLDVQKQVIYAGVSDFSGGPGSVELFDEISGTFIRSFTTGIGPAHFAFYH